MGPQRRDRAHRPHHARGDGPAISGAGLGSEGFQGRLRARPAAAGCRWGNFVNQPGGGSRLGIRLRDPGDARIETDTTPGASPGDCGAFRFRRGSGGGRHEGAAARSGRARPPCRRGGGGAGDDRRRQLTAAFRLKGAPARPLFRPVFSRRQAVFPPIPRRGLEPPGVNMGRRPRRDPGTVPASHRKRRAAAGPILARITAWTPLSISANPSSSCPVPTARSRSPISSRSRTSRCASGRHRHPISRPAVPERCSPTAVAANLWGGESPRRREGGGAAGFRAPPQRASPSWAAALVRAGVHRFPHRAAAASPGRGLCRLRGRACRRRARKAPRPLGVPLPEQLAAAPERPRRGGGAVAPDGAGDRPQAARADPRAPERPRRLRPQPLRRLPAPGRGAQSGENRGPRPPPRIDEVEFGRLRAISAELGHGAALTEGDALIAGDLICIADNRAYFLTGGYEPDFQRFSPGMITLSHAIEACRRRGILDFNLLWGDGVYKQRLGGRCQPLVTIVSRRSPATLLRPAYLAALSRFGWLHLKRALKPMLARLKGVAPEKPGADAKGDLPPGAG